MNYPNCKAMHSITNSEIATDLRDILLSDLIKSISNHYN